MPPSTSKSIFRVGSVTKVFTALMLMMLKEQGKVRLDDDVSRYVPAFTVNNPFDEPVTVTLRGLASHMAGYPRCVVCA